MYLLQYVFMLTDKPLVQIKSTKLGDYYILNRLYTITCNTESVPPVDFGDIWIEFSPCGIDLCNDNTRRQWKKLSDSNLKVEYEAQEGSGFQLMLYASQTGVFRCKAKNEVGNTTSANEIVKISGKCMVNHPYHDFVQISTFFNSYLCKKNMEIEKNFHQAICDMREKQAYKKLFQNRKLLLIVNHN